jgi:hypothetical protein
MMAVEVFKPAIRAEAQIPRNKCKQVGACEASTAANTASPDLHGKPAGGLVEVHRIVYISGADLSTPSGAVTQP